MLSRYEFFREELILENLINETYIYYAPTFDKQLRKIRDNEIAKSLLDIKNSDIKSDVTFVDIDKDGYLSFTTARNAGNNLSKIWPHVKPDNWFNSQLGDGDLDEIWKKHINGSENDVYTKSRSILRIGRFVNKLFPGKYSDKQIEEFVNKLKSTLEVEGEKFELIEGPEIAKWYHYDNYAEQKGTLGSSCMKDKPNEIFKIYTENPEVCKMLILREGGLLLGRAILWKLNSFKSSSNKEEKAEYFLDRQYYIKESDVEKFRQYAKEQGWAYKSYNNHHSFYTVVFNDKEFNASMTVQLKKSSGGSYNYHRYPYVDTFRRYDPNSGILYNDEDTDEDNQGQYILASTGGGYTEIEGGIWSEWHDRMIPEEYAVWSSWADSYLDSESAIEVIYGSRGNRGWYPEDCDDTVYDEWNDIIIHRDDSVYSESYGYYLLDSDAVEVIGDVHHSGDVLSGDSNWYHKDDRDILKVEDLDDVCLERLTDLYRDWKRYDYIEKDLLTKNYKGNWIIKRFMLNVYPIKEAKDNSVDITGIEWLTEVDAEILGYELSSNRSEITDEFRYHRDIEDILPIIYKICVKEASKIRNILDDKGQLRLKFDYEDDKEYLEKLENKLRIYNLRISDIDDKVYIDIDIEDEKNEKLKMKNLKRFENFSNEHTQDEMNDVWRKLNKMAENYGDDVWELIELAFDQNSMSIEDFVNKLPEAIGDHNYIISVLNQIKKEGI
jgi:hypothetical protein